MCGSSVACVKLVWKHFGVMAEVDFSLLPTVGDVLSMTVVDLRKMAASLRIEVSHEANKKELQLALIEFVHSADETNTLREGSVDGESGGSLDKLMILRERWEHEARLEREKREHEMKKEERDREERKEREDWQSLVVQGDG